MKRFSLVALGMLATLVVSGGASCRSFSLQRQPAPTTPVAFGGPPTLENIIYAVNANSASVQQLAAESAALSSPELPTRLRATLQVERPRRFRLKARLIGQELDLGSNDELFWFWANRDPDRALYYSYHAQFVQDAGNPILPIGPDWVIEALGLVHLEPGGAHDGPHARPDGNWEVRTRLERSGSVFYRTLVIHGKYGWIQEQRIEDVQRRPLAIARGANHTFYPEAGATLAHHVQIELPPARMMFEIIVPRYTLNAPFQDPQTFALEPGNYEGFHLVNLAQMAR